VLETLPGKPAEIAGLKAGDIIRKLDKLENPRLSEMQAYVDKAQGTTVKVTVERGGEMLVKEIASLFNTSTGKGGFGVGILETGVVRYPWYAAIYQGAKSTGEMFWAITSGFYHLVGAIFSGEGVGGSVSGPIGVAKMTGQVAKMGWVYLLQFTAMLSLNLAVLNILPIPALDGGRLLFVIIEKIIGRKVEPKYEQLAHTIGFAALMLLVVFVTARDIHVGTMVGQMWRRVF
jgi:regulator of sigma E protease